LDITKSSISSAPGEWAWDTQLGGKTREKVKIQYRCEFFNGLNHPMFDSQELSATSSNFSRILRQANLARRIPVALRLGW
jgi:hypothetical protein